MNHPPIAQPAMGLFPSRTNNTGKSYLAKLLYAWQRYIENRKAILHRGLSGARRSRRDAYSENAARQLRDVLQEWGQVILRLR